MIFDRRDDVTAPAALPYRACVGIALFNRNGLVFVGRRIDTPGEPEGPGQWWQMPQGGIDDGEDLYAAALRELYEETNVRSVARLGEMADWLRYDLPATLSGTVWGGRYRGQRQKWFALRFAGEDAEIDVRRPAGGAHKPEFLEWRWERLDHLPDLIVPFKRAVYEAVVTAFRPFAQPR